MMIDEITLTVIKADADYLMRHGPFEPHRLPLDEMEYTTMPQVMKRLDGRFEPLEG